MNINSYVWKDARLSKDKREAQVETRLVDMDEEQLQLVYNHCKQMLYNTDPKNEGRMIVADHTVSQIANCKAELAFRWFMNRTDSNKNQLYTKDALLFELRSCTNSYPNQFPDKKITLGQLFKVPKRFEDVSISNLINVCLGHTEKFDDKKITFSFLYHTLGIYLTSEECKEVDQTIRDKGQNPDTMTLQDKLDNYIKHELKINDAIDIKVNSNGLTLSEFKEVLNLKRSKVYKNCKLSVLTTEQLSLLVFKVLTVFLDKVFFQAKRWQTIMGQIEEVANYNGYKLE